MEPVPEWKLWFNRRGKLKGVAIVFRCSDYGLEMQPNGLSEADRIEWCKKLCERLNQKPRNIQ
jgi:hypothetical protein